MRRQYRQPELVEYGRIEQLTLGASGGQPDYVVVGRVLKVNPSNPSCTNNLSSGGCVPNP